MRLSGLINTIAITMYEAKKVHKWRNKAWDSSKSLGAKDESRLCEGEKIGQILKEKKSHFDVG